MKELFRRKNCENFMTWIEEVNRNKNRSQVF